MKRYFTLCTLIFLGLLSHQDNATMAQEVTDPSIEQDAKQKQRQKDRQDEKNKAKKQAKADKKYEERVGDQYKEAQKRGLTHTIMNFNKKDKAKYISGAKMTDVAFQLAISKVVFEAKSNFAMETYVEFQDDISEYQFQLVNNFKDNSKKLLKRLKKNDTKNVKNKQLLEILITKSVESDASGILKNFYIEVKALEQIYWLDFIEKISNDLDKIGEDFYTQLLATGQELYGDQEMSEKDQDKLFEQGLNTFEESATPVYEQLLEAEKTSFAPKYTLFLTNAVKDANALKPVNEDL